MLDIKFLVLAASNLVIFFGGFVIGHMWDRYDPDAVQPPEKPSYRLPEYWVALLRDLDAHNGARKCRAGARTWWALDRLGLVVLGPKDAAKNFKVTLTRRGREWLD